MGQRIFVPRIRDASAPRVRGSLGNTASLQDADFAMTDAAIDAIGEDIITEDEFAYFHWSRCNGHERMAPRTKPRYAEWMTETVDAIKGRCAIRWSP